MTVSKQAASRYLSSPDEIAQVFKSMRDLRVEMQLHFESDSAGYTSKVLDISPKTLLLEDIKPRDGYSRFQEGAIFSLSGRSEGLYVHSMTNRTLKVESERGVPYIQVAMPTRVLYQQRRRLPRVKLSHQVRNREVDILLFRHGHEESLPGRIVDISVGGCRVELRQEPSPALVVDEVLASCFISISNSLEINSRGIIRHSHTNQKNRTVACGIEFEEMSITDRRRLEQFIDGIEKSVQRPQLVAQ